MAKKKETENKEIFDISIFLKRFTDEVLKVKYKGWDQTYIPSKIFENLMEYYMWISERSDGKTYIACEMVLYLHLWYNYSGAMIRRWDEDLVYSNGVEIIKNLIGFNELVYKRTKGKWDNAVMEIFEGKYNTIDYESRKWYLAYDGKDEEGKDVHIRDKKPFLYAFAISKEERKKGTSYPDIKITIFDEFISRGTYLPEEFISYQNLLSTIIRRRTDVINILCANAINRYCIYFQEMGLKHVKDQKQGTIDYYQFGDPVVMRVAVEMIYPIDNKYKQSNKYFAFDNPKLKMITEGKFELAIYPHCPVRFKPKDIKFTYYIIFDGECFQCNIVKVDDKMFTFIHPKTTEIEINRNTIIYTPEINVSPHYRRKITYQEDQIGSMIASFYKRDKVFYSDNSVGDTIHNYLLWCGSMR